MLGENEGSIGKYSDKEERNDVLDAIQCNNWARLRELSLRPGGFGEERLQAWPFLLHANAGESSTTTIESNEPTRSKLRKRRRSKHANDLKEKEASDGEPSQRHHTESTEKHADEHQIKLDTDRSFVLYPAEKENEREELQAQLNLLITSVFRRHKRLSYFQGYHDIITVLYLTLTEDLTLRCSEKISLHRLRDSMGHGLEPLMGLLQILKYLLRLADPDYAALLERNTPLPYFALSNLLTLFSHDVPTLELIQHIFDFLLCRPPIATVYLAAAITLKRKEEAFELEREGEEGMLHSLLASLPTLYNEEESPILSTELTSRKHEESEDTFVKEEEQSISPSNQETVAALEGATNDSEPDNKTKSEEIKPKVEAEDEDTTKTSNKAAEEAQTSLDNNSNDSNFLGGDSLSEVISPKPPSRPPSSLSDASFSRAKAPKIFLPTLLKETDELLAKFPPTHPSLHVSSIIGPQSVINTWSEDPHDLASDEEAEAMVTHPELVVFPFVDPDELAAKESDSAGYSEDSDTGRSPSARHRRKLRKPRRPHRFGHMRHFGVQLDKKTVLTGAVVALGVAAAVYSMRGKPGAATAGQGGVYEYVRGAKAWRKAAQWVSGAVIGGNEELLRSFGW